MDFTDLRVMRTQERLQNALLGLLEERELKAITVKEICGAAGISRNAFYQHYGYKEDLYEQMVARATEGIREALEPVVADASALGEDSVAAYARHIVDGVSEVRDLLRVMLRRDGGVFLRQLTDLIFGQNLANAQPFFGVGDSRGLRLALEFQSAGMAAFVIRWVQDDCVSAEEAASLLASVLLEAPALMAARLAG
ncbi:MAG: TetR/AcrR family transcriptional regulator [Coriobacteriales bacterium]|nr:TetR/AcrR family transcriptional regulator [Coriobacteriales bacterium]